MGASMSAWGKSWGFAWGNAWGLLERPYVDLSNAERVYVRELLSAIYVRDDVEQIVSVAATQQISVVDAEQVLCVRYGTEPILVREVVEDKSSPVRQAAPKPIKPQEPVFVRETSDIIFIKSGGRDAIFIKE